MLITADIQLSNVFIGKVRIDSSQIRGEGGWLDPHLIIPIEIELYQRPENQQLVLMEVSCALKLDGNPGTANQIGSSVHLNLIRNLNYRTFPNAPTANTLQLPFNLTQEQVKKLEEAREDSHQGPFTLYVELEGVVAWLAGTGNSVGIHQSKPSILRGENLPLEFGMYSELIPFWNTSIGVLRVALESTTWVNVLSGLGYDRVRLVEINLAQMHEAGFVASQFDKARRYLDEGHYEECIAACRGIKNAWETRLKASKKKPVAAILAEKLGWTQEDPHYQLIDKTWEGLHIMTSAFHHPEELANTSNGSEETSQLIVASAADARFCFFQIVILSEYVERLCSDAHI
jgi:hypothetical protein